MTWPLTGAAMVSDMPTKPITTAITAAMRMARIVSSVLWRTLVRATLLPCAAMYGPSPERFPNEGRSMAHRLTLAALSLAASAAGAAPVPAQAPRLDTDQSYVEQVRAAENLDVADPMA